MVGTRLSDKKYSVLAVLIALLAGVTAGFLAFRVEGGEIPAALVGALSVAAACGAAWLAGRRYAGARVDKLIRTGLEAGGDVWLLGDRHGRVLYATNDAHKLLERLDADGPSFSLGRFVGLLDREEAVREFERLMVSAREGRRDHGEIPMRGSKGLTEWHRVSVAPVDPEDGIALWHFDDVTARREIDAVLRQEQDTLVDFIDRLPTGFIAEGPDGRILYANEALCGWLGLGSVEMRARNMRFSDLVIDQENGPSNNDDARDGDGEPPHGEVLLQTADGGAFRASVVRSDRLDGEGNLLYSRAVVVPGMVWRGESDAGAMSWDQAPKWLFADAPVGVVLCDLHGSVADCNRAFLKLLGVHRDSVVGRPLADWIRKEDRSDISGQLSKIVMGTTPAAHLEVRMSRSAERERVVSLFASRMTDDKNEVFGLIVHCIDTTEQKVLEVQFAQSQRIQAVGQLAGGVAHDFNNLLTAMIGFCDLLLERHGPEDSSFADIMQIKQNANRATNLVRQLLAFSRKQTMQPVELDVGSALSDLSNLLRRLIGEAIELKMEHGRDLGVVRVDPGQFDQVIVNLAVNARDAMPKGGTLHVRTSRISVDEPLERGHEVMSPGAYVLIEIADTGIGIPKENIAHIFDPFFSTKEVGEGTGLGLSTVYGIVRQTGGYIFVDSAPGEGTSFSVYLPIAGSVSAVAAGVAGERVSERKRDLTGAGTVLIVEDEDAVRMFGARALRNKGYNVLEAENGEAALELINTSDDAIDLIVSDVVMPGMDGHTLVRLVQQEMPHVRVILTSGYAENVLPDDIGNTPGLHFLPKPFTLQDLAAKVKEVIET